MSPEKRGRRSEQQRMQQRNLKKVYSLLAKIFVCLLAVIAVVNVAGRDKEFSDAENRMLAQRPEFTWESVKSGKYMSEFEDYVADQFFLRNQWITLKFWEDRLMGRKESNGVYLGKKGYLMEVPDTPDMKNVRKNAESMKKFAARHPDIPVYVSLAPNACYILEDKMPYGAPVRDQAQDISQVRAMLGEDIKYIDVTDTLKEHEEEYIYYKTDHHWTSLGARYAFERLAEGMDIENLETDYQVYTVADDFQGTLASKSGYHGSQDLVQVYRPENLETDYVVFYTEEGEKTASIYNSASLKEKDKYTVFFGGNHARIDISTTQEERKNLLLFKDSYANSLVQFLLPYYQNIIVVDPRYFYENVDSIIESRDITDILFLYNVNTFLGDNSIADVLAEEVEAESPQEE